MKIILIVLLVLGFLIPVCCGTTIDIYYPNDNMTTQIYYAEGSNYSTTLANNVTGDLTAVVIDNEKEYDDIIESPHLIIKSIFGLVMLIIIISFIVLVATLVKKIWR